VGTHLQLIAFLALTTGVGLMLQAGLGKNMLEWRRRQRVCPSCGREVSSRGCGCA
jgi:NADH pyrophosphatase NudC (nudix superfamily)